MKFNVKVRCIQGGKDVSILYSTLVVDAADSDEANRIGFSKARVRYPGVRDVRVMSVEAVDELEIPPAMRRMVVQDGKLKRVTT